MEVETGIQPGDTVEMKEIKEWNFNDFLNFAIMQTLKAAAEDVVKFSICVDNLESLMIDELEGDADYDNALKEKAEKLAGEYGSRKDPAMLREFAVFKMKMLFKRLKAKIPVEMVGRI